MQIQVKSIVHKGESRLALYFEYDPSIIQIAKSVPGYKYSSTHKAFHFPRSKETVASLQKAFEGIAQLTKATDNATPSSTPQINNSTAPTPVTETKKETQLPEKKAPVAPSNRVVQIVPGDSTLEGKIKQFQYWMQSRRYSQNTVHTYSDAIRSFLKFFRHKVLEEITNNDVILYNNEFIRKYALSASYQNQAVNAIKLFFTTVENRSLVIEQVHRPKKAKMLPNVLSKEEVKLILNAHNNLKHRTMLSLIYSCGLRCGELLALKPEHVDRNRQVLIIKHAKGRKDRIAPLSGKIIEMLDEYGKTCKPLVYLFEGMKPGEMYDVRSLQHVLKQALAKVGITKPATLHWLRHSYATHLLENGTDLRYIQEILGHASSKTTEIYTHVSTKNIQKITSPFDYL
jgi:integrase/recombinase XerD